MNDIPVLFGSIVLNEERFVADSIAQHADLCDAWFIVEGADKLFHPRTGSGLSIDRTAEEVASLMARRPNVMFKQFGLAQDKVVLRNVYAAGINGWMEEHGVERAIVFAIDVDEFLCRADAESLIDWMRRCYAERPDCIGAIRLPTLHYWRDATRIITGKYFDVPHDRVYFWPRGAMYGDNHNHPEFSGRKLQTIEHIKLPRPFLSLGGVTDVDGLATNGITSNVALWHHFGNCRDDEEMRAKNQYYVARGEATTRPETTESRAAFFTELKTGRLPAGVSLHDWLGPWPEVVVERADAYGLANHLDGHRGLRISRRYGEPLWLNRA